MAVHGWCGGMGVGTHRVWGESPLLSPSPSSQDAIAPRRTAKATTVAVLDQNTQKLEELLAKGEGRATLRLKKDGQAVVEQVVSCLLTSPNNPID